MIAELLHARIVPVEHKIFPDGESYIRLAEDIGGEDVLLVHTTYPQQDKTLIELLFLVNTLKDLGASRIRAVVPYIAYARQDTRFRDGEVVSIKTVFRLIEAAGCDEFYTVDVHKEVSLNAFGIMAKNLHASEAIAEYLKGLRMENPYVLSPDKGALEIARRIGEKMGAEFGNFEKTRDRITGAITTRGEEVEARGMDIVIADDLISTGGTIANACRIVRQGGAKRVLAVCSHALLMAGAYDRMREAGIDEVLATDTVESSVSRISVAPLIAKEFSGIG
jgi:ribose-phosphate pyrophosphokinase